MAFEIIKREAFKFSPGIDTGIAFATLIMMIPVYYLNANFGYEKPVFFFVGFLGVGHILLNTLIPAFTVFVLCREGWNGLGFTKRRIILSLVLSILMAGLMWPQLREVIASFEGSVTPHIIFNGISLWEPLFVYGWLQLRFEKAFGFIVAPILAGAAFAAYHIGSFPIESLIVFLVSGVVYGVLFAITKNLIVLIPITWAVGSTIGTIEGGFSFGWDTVGIYASLLVLQLLLLIWINTRAKKRQH